MTYEEIQRLPSFVLWGTGLFCIVLAGIIALFGVDEDSLLTFVMVAAATIIPIGAIYFLFRLDIRVSANELTVRFFPLPQRRIAKSDIVKAEPVLYHPVRDFGGWGVRYGPGGKIYSARGNRAVKLSLRSGEVVYVGTERPDDLSSCL